MSTVLDPIESPPAAPAPTEVPPATKPITRIVRRSGWELVNFRELWRHRELLFLLAYRDVSVRFKQTILGVAWALAQPLATMVVFSVFFGRLGGLSAGFEHYPLYVFAGILPWTFFSNAVSAAGNSLLANSGMLTKVYFPRVILPLSAIGAPLFDLIIACGVLGAMMAWYGVAPGWGVLMLPVLILQLAVTAVGVGLFLSALIVAQRDFRFLLGFGIQLWMFATPVIYLGVDSLGPTARTWLPLNPAYGPILNFRSAVLNEPFDWYALGVSALVGIVALGIGLVYFRRVETSFADMV